MASRSPARCFHPMAVVAMLTAAVLLHAGTSAAVPSIVMKKPGQSDSGMVIDNPPPDRAQLPSRSGKKDSVCHGPYELVHGPVSAKWNSLRVVFAFYEYSWTECAYANAETYSMVDGFVYFPTEQTGRYKRVFIRSFDGGGREPATVEAVFFANADRDKAQELGVLTSYEAEWKDAPSGKFYSAVFLDDRKHPGPDSLEYLKDLSENKVGESCSAHDSNGKLFGEYHYRTVAEVKKRLKKLGY